MKAVFLIVVSLFSTGAIACFIQPEGLVAEHQAQFNKMLIMASLLIVLALMTRWFSDRRRFWVPFVGTLVCGLVPGSLYYLYFEDLVGAGGACGRQDLINVGRTAMISFSILFLYELVNFLKFRRSR